MPVVDKVLSRFGLHRKADPPAPPVINSTPSVRVSYVSTLPGAYWTSRDYTSLAQAGYRQNSDVYACVSLIASAGKQVRWDTGPGSKSQASIDVLKHSGGASLIEAWLSYLLLSGNDYFEIGRVENGTRPYVVYLIQPDLVRAKLDPAAVRTDEESLVQMWDVRDARGRPYAVAPDDMLHSKLFNPLDPVYGMPPLEAAMLNVDAQNEGAELMKRVLQRGYAPGWIEAAKDSIWEDTQVAQLKERIKSSKAKGEELFLENASWHQMGFPPADSGVSEQKVLSKRDIASVFHVPPQLIGDTQSQTYSNYQEARRALYMEAVVPLLAQFRDDWNETIGAELDSPLEFDKDSFDAIAAARSDATERVHKLWTAGLITQNEGRRDLEYDPVPGGNAFYAPANFLPLGDAAAAEPVPAPKKDATAEQQKAAFARDIEDACAGLNASRVEFPPRGIGQGGGS